ncbi:hypothetical protein CEK62_13810 [Alcanivorax sp. N3-2A]|nr:hypothetical protein CEK62_13810 [Alcanivorax sp. N3-2A]
MPTWSYSRIGCGCFITGSFCETGIASKRPSPDSKNRRERFLTSRKRRPAGWPPWTAATINGANLLALFRFSHRWSRAPPMDKLKAMSTFVAIVDQGSLSAAGDKLDRSPAAIVRTLAGLERHLGVRLLNRSTRRLALTDEGRDYLQHCR